MSSTFLVYNTYWKTTQRQTTAAAAAAAAAATTTTTTTTICIAFKQIHTYSKISID